MAFGETCKWSNYPATKHTDNSAPFFFHLIPAAVYWDCSEILQLSSAQRLKVNIWKYESSVCVCVRVCMSSYVYVCVSICLSPCVLPSDKMGTQSSRWAYSHLRTLRWGSRFGSGSAGGLIRSLGSNINLSCTKDSAEREGALISR